VGESPSENTGERPPQAESARVFRDPDNDRKSRIVGSILGLALGDAFGAPYEGGLAERALWTLIGSHRGRRRWTDDTQMTIDTAESLIKHGDVDQDDLARRFAQSYRWSRGYGPGAAKILKRIGRGQPWQTASRSVYRDGSYGNGGAMRVPVVGLFFADEGEARIVDAARASAAVTHAHPLGQEGAALVALATALAASDAPTEKVIETLFRRAQASEYRDRLRMAREWLYSEHQARPLEVASKLGNGIAAWESCVTAVYLALRFETQSFDELLDFAIRIGGDVDTIAAMATAIWGAAQGCAALPEEQLRCLDQRERLEALAEALAHTITERSHLGE